MMKKIIVLGVAALTLMLSGCSSDDRETIVIASKPMTEQLIIAEMLSLLVEENTDLRVEKKLGIGGGTANIWPAMQEGEIDLYPEYTGTAWYTVLKETTKLDEEQMYEAVKEQYLQEYNVVWSDLYGFNDTYGLAMKEADALKYNIKTYSDLAKLSEDLILGAEYDFYEREDGYPALAEVYGFDFKKNTELDIGLKYNAIDAFEVDVINIFTTDGRIVESELFVLEDDQAYFPSYYAATLIRGEVLEKHPELEMVLGLLNGQISNEEMTQMNYLVEIDNEEPGQVARDFLIDKELLKDD